MCHVAKALLKMKKSNEISVKFDENLLNQLLKNANSCVHLQTCQQHLALRPVHLNDVINAVQNELNAGVAKYNKNLDGILFGYKNLKLLASTGAVLTDTCPTHLNVEADFFVFKPVINSKLRAVVNKKSNDHIGCLVHKTFNVSLPKPEDDSDWLGSSVQLNSDILIRIKQTNFEPFLPYIQGEILSVLSDDSGISTGEESYVKKKRKIQVEEDEPEVLKKKRNKSHEGEFTELKNKKIKFDSDSELVNKKTKTKIKEEKSEKSDSSKKKSKRDKAEVDINVLISENNDTFSKKLKKSRPSEVNIKIENTEDKSPKKKRKKSKSVSETSNAETIVEERTKKIKKEKCEL